MLINGHSLLQSIGSVGGVDRYSFLEPEAGGAFIFPARGFETVVVEGAWAPTIESMGRLRLWIVC